MKNELSILLLSCFSLLLLIHCRKESVVTDSPENILTYQYSGQNYTDTGSAILDPDNKIQGIEFRNSSVFGGIIFFYSLPANCAFLVPDNSSYMLLAGCRLSFADPVDSSKIYYYRSGAINYSYSNCKHKIVHDLVTGIHAEYDECSVTGTFSLTLGNKNNEKIAVTNGSFVFKDVRK